MTRILPIVFGAALLFNGSVVTLAAQEAAATTAVQSPVLTIDQDRLYSQSLWGKRAEGELAAATSALQAENRKIEAELTAEEKSLTEKRTKMPAADFRKLADDFDSRVTGIRKAQDGKSRELAAKRDEDRRAFFDAAVPIIGEVMQKRGAVAILDSRAIFLSAKLVDATDEVLAVCNARLGAGPKADGAP